MALVDIGGHHDDLIQPEEAGKARDIGSLALPGTALGAGERGVIEAACDMIEQGRFEAAGQLIEESSEGKGQGDGLVAQLKDIVEQWRQLQKSRQSQRETSYKEQAAKLERLKAGLPFDETQGGSTDGNDVNSPRRDSLEGMRIFAQQWLEDAGLPTADNDADEQKEPDGAAAVLAVVMRTIEFADEGQKGELLSDPCVLNAIDRSKAEAAELEAKGKWLDAYVVCYSWLAAIDPNNKDYANHAEQLIDKAEIAASFQDSPCETGKQRFDGVKKRIFERAVDALNFNYINKIDYRQMSVKGVRQCRLLAEVVGTLANSVQRSADSGQHSVDSVQRTAFSGQKAEDRGQEPNVSVLGESFKDFKPDANSMALLCSALGALEQEVNNWPEGAGRDSFVDVFNKVLELNLTTARLPGGLVIAQFAEASFLALDPYTVIVWPKQVQDFEKAMMNEFSGIGVEITRQRGQLTIGSLLPDTPAYNSGLDAGDVIESVDGAQTKDMPLLCAVKQITGPAGTKVTLRIRSEGQREGREVTITRAKITVPTVRGWKRDEEGKWLYMIDEPNKIGYVQLTSFSEKTASDMEEALKSLEAAGMRGLILDLRYNPGGIFDSAVNVADAFLDEGLIVMTRPRFGIPTYVSAHSKGTHPNYPVVVLINTGSASASEIVAGALADPSHHRATLVGERTHGKGVVQGITHYPGDGAQLKYTMAYYHLPSGQRVKSKEEAEKENGSDWGIGPTVTVGLRSDELRKMFDVQRDNDVLVKVGHDNAVSPVKKYTPEQTVESDPQLSTGILVMKSKLIRERALRLPQLRSGQIRSGQARAVVKKAA
jgi:carboxyl-terminal processing protease